MSTAKGRRNRCGLLLGAAAVAWALGAVAFGQSCPPPAQTPLPTKYHPRPLAWIGDLDGSEECWYASILSPSAPEVNPFSPGDGLGVASMSAGGEIVGTYLTVVQGVKVPRPFIWLPQSHYGLDAGFHDLLSVYYPPPNEHPEVIGYAWDISDAGIVVGGKGGHPDTTEGCRATAWDLGSMTEVALDSGSTSLTWSIALAIEPVSDVDAPIEIVGTGGFACATWRRPLRFEIGENPGALPFANPPPSADDPSHIQALRKWACDVTNGALLHPVGSVDTPAPEAVSACTLPGPGSTGCEIAMLAGVAFHADVPVWFRLAYDSDEDAMNAQATGVRSITGIPDPDPEEPPSTAIVAGYVYQVSGLACVRAGSLWHYPSDLLTAEVLPPVAGYTSMAQRWRDLACGTEVVLGWTAEAIGEDVRGLVWDRCPTGGGICANALKDLALLEGRNEVPLQLYDILETGEIVGLARHLQQGHSSLPDGIYLAIFTLRGDFDHDGRINASDLAILLGAWGQTDEIEIDISDHATDQGTSAGIIDAADMALLLGFWSGDDQVPLELPCSGEFCPPGTGPPGESMTAGQPLELPLAAFGFSSIGEFVAWGSSADLDSLQSVCTAMAWIMQAGNGGEQ